MGLSNLRRFDVQAKYAAVLAVVSVVPLFSALFLVWRNYNHQLGQIVYGSGGSFIIMLLGCVVASSLPSFSGFVLGWSSAGQRRNETPTKSWIGFFLGAGVLTTNFVILIAFWMLRLKQG